MFRPQFLSADTLTHVQFSSVQSLDRFGRRGDMRNDSSEILFQSLLQEALVSEQFSHSQGCPLFDIVYTAILLPTTASPILQGALKDGSGEAVVTYDV